MSIQVGQRYLFRYGSDRDFFVGEVEEVIGPHHHSIRVVQVFKDTVHPLGHLYPACNLLDGNWTLLEGQDRPRS